MFKLPYKFTFHYNDDKGTLFTGQMSINRPSGEVICIVMWEKDGELTGVTYPEDVVKEHFASEAWTIVDILSN
ncbi:hypothetical protein PQE66_gp117 [Bacillus phage PBC2]|uniref:Uncharacterized protein n=1 Tax=Bacillus phage PBC2 TaxID=1675029 RepID=A0A218KC14_9CAUD|nr:hypothetical protein PQE66_gp117 [Bacillus phage PBC2]AKQ08432.1 hypothetical protein PBC2_117 [Bacillus phage PBC2]